ncbi:hypothetical protein [Thermoactinospora rubra]|uniref:hypothetical protein n=1 Tax=Thermoactinospora rubra TaxID=1088767 RepID=UPI000A11222A|nr:hypothetical protein [Thermoactinospora rubra]
MDTPSREGLHRRLAAELRNRTVIRFTVPDTDRGPTHHRDGDAWLIRLSPAEAHTATSVIIETLEKLGVIPTRAIPFTALRDQVAAALDQAGHRPAGEDDFGYRMHRPVDSGDHLLVVCEVGGMWQAMPGQAVRSAIAQHLGHYAATLTAAGYGVAAWERDGQPAALIVAATQESADAQAPAVRQALTELNPAKEP